MKCLLLILALSLLCLPVFAEAQGIRAEIKSQPLVQFDFDCTKESLYPGKKLNRLVRSLIEEPAAPWVWGNRAFTFDLNGDKVDEYFVPLECGAIGGNCRWGIFVINPVRLLGFVSGESIYVHKRIGRWSQLTVATHLTVSDSGISTYRVVKGRYRKFGKDYDASAYRDDFPKSLLTVHPVCNPSYRQEGAQN